MTHFTGCYTTFERLLCIVLNSKIYIMIVNLLFEFITQNVFL